MKPEIIKGWVLAVLSLIAKALRWLAIAVVLWVAGPQFAAAETAKQTPVPAPAVPVFAVPASAIPLPLSSFDVQQYQRLFHLQEQGRMKQAIREMGRLEDRILTGHLLSQRYLHPTAWRSSYSELSSWLKRYNDHPDASRIYWLAKKRKPKNAAGPTAPKSGYLNGFGLSTGNSYRPRIPVSSAGRASPRKTRSIAREIRRAIRRGWPSGALKLIDDNSNRRYLTNWEESQLRGEIAHAYFIFGVDSKAVRQARYALGVSRDEAVMGSWAGGLAAWRSGDIEFAGALFRDLAENETAFPALRSAGAFWAHRVEMRFGRPKEAMRYLQIAAKDLDSFYGVIARVALGQDFDLGFELPAYDSDFLDWLSSRPGGQRLFALLQIGRYNDAERELRYLWGEMPDSMKEAALRFTLDNGMAGLAYRAGSLLAKNSGRTFLGAIYPIPLYDVEFTVDQALVWAISRQESGFNPRAKSRARAAGLMQIMPSTASFVTKDRGYRGSQRHLLLNPERNLEIGQAYIRSLLDEPLIDRSIVHLLAAYNGGPGNLRKWLRKVDYQDDPFLLIESIPARETRHYIKNVITNFALYRMQLGDPSPELLALASGSFGRFDFTATDTVVDSADGS